MDNQDTTALIWDDVYLVRVPLIASMSIEEIKQYGFRTSGNKAIDDSIDKQWTRIGINIDKMIDLFKEGITIYLLDKSDSKRIYDAISKHILAWKYQLERGINIGGAPIDDLIVMDQFANEIYDNAKYNLEPEFVESIFGQQLLNVQRLGASNFFNGRNGKSAINREKGKTEVRTVIGSFIINPKPNVDEPPERDGLETFFKSRKVNLR